MINGQYNEGGGKLLDLNIREVLPFVSVKEIEFDKMR